MNNIVKNIIAGICFCVFLFMVFIGQRSIGYEGLAIQLIGLCGLLVLLFLYNRKFQ